MKKPVVAAALLILAAGAAFYFRPAVRPETGATAPPSTPTPRAPAEEDPDFAANAALKTGDTGAIRSLAAEWRKAARKRGEFRARMIQLVRDESAPLSERELAAFVLGTLPDPVGLAALSDALAAARDPRWVRSLLLALGCDRASGDDDDIFGLPDTPRVIAIPLGLSVRIRGALADAALRVPMIPRLTGSEDAGVRWAAALALADSTGFSDVREAFLRMLPGERNPAAQGEAAKALADWAAGETAESSERPRIFTALLGEADRPDAAALRLRSEDGLKRMAWTGAEVRTMAIRMESGSLDQRRWAIAVLAGAASRAGTPEREFVVESLARTAGSAAEAKVREFAVTGLTSFSDHPRARALLVSSLGDAAWHVRAAAVRALGKAGGSTDVAAALQRVEREDSDERVRRAAAEALRSLPGK